MPAAPPSAVPAPAPRFDVVLLAAQNLWAQRLKAVFMATGVAVGVAFLVLIVGVVGGLSRYVTDDVLGRLIQPNTITLRVRPPPGRGAVDAERARRLAQRPSLTPEQARAARDAVPEAPGASSSFGTARVRSALVRRSREVWVYAVSGDYAGVRGLRLSSGRAPSPAEDARAARVVLLGPDVATYFFPGVTPEGRLLDVAGTPYTVIGVAEPQGRIAGVSLDKYVLLPEASPVARRLRGTAGVQTVLVRLGSARAVSDAMERMRGALRPLRGLRPGQPDDFDLSSSVAAAQFLARIQGVLTLAAVALPGIGLLVGAIIIMNLMVMVVTERTREIGVRRALGATRRAILRMILAESLGVALVGGLVGLGVGALALVAVRLLTPLTPVLPLWAPLLALGASGGTGVLAGLWPAARASRLDPATALRAE